MNGAKWLGPLTIACVFYMGMRADEKTDFAKMVVGKWEVTKSGGKEMPKGSWTFEITKDGKLKGAIRSTDGMEIKFDGTYKIDGNKITVTLKDGEQEVTTTSTITKLTEAEMVIKDKDGKVDEMTKVK